MKLESNRRVRYYRYIAIVLAIFLSVSAVLFALRAWEVGRDRYPEFTFDDGVIEYGGVKYEPRENVETLLMLGLDKMSQTQTYESYNNDMQADFLLLMVLDNDAKTCSAVHINRDTVANVQVLGVNGNPIETVSKQIALAHTYGNGKEVSCRNTADAVSDLLHGARVDHFISLKMDAVPMLNDLLGGVEVEVLDDFGSIDPTLIKGERVTLKGEQALTYVRARGGVGDGTNLSRMKRQQQYMGALIDSYVERGAADETFIIDTIVKMSEQIVSDRTVNQLDELFNKLKTYDRSDITDFDGESKVVNGLNEFYPDNQAVEQLVIDLFYKVKE